MHTDWGGAQEARWNTTYTKANYHTSPPSITPYLLSFIAKPLGIVIYTYSQTSFSHFLLEPTSMRLWLQYIMDTYRWPLCCLIQWLILSTNVTCSRAAFVIIKHFFLLKHFLHLYFICLVSKIFYALDFPTSLAVLS